MASRAGLAVARAIVWVGPPLAEVAQAVEEPVQLRLVASAEGRPRTTSR
jgi:hypothetical protein